MDTRKVLPILLVVERNLREGGGGKGKTGEPLGDKGAHGRKKREHVRRAVAKVAKGGGVTRRIRTDVPKRQSL